MNIRKNIDYTEMYEALDVLMAQQLPQMELYCGIGKAVCRRTEKGAAVMASEYLNKNYPDVKGFSPRSSAECGTSTVPTKIILLCCPEP